MLEQRIVCDECGEAIDADADRFEVMVSRLEPTRNARGDAVGPAVPHEQPRRLHYHADHAPEFVGRPA